MSIDKESDIDENDLTGDYEPNQRKKVFNPTFELQYVEINEWLPALNRYDTTIQQKWANELGEEEWRDIPLVIQG